MPRGALIKAETAEAAEAAELAYAELLRFPAASAVSQSRLDFGTNA